MGNRIIKVKICYKNNGLLLTCIIYFRKIINKLYNFIIIGRKDTLIDSRAKIIGYKGIKIGHNFYAGKGLWLEAVSNYNEQLKSPKLIIGNDVSFSDFNHIGATNLVKIGNHVLFGSKCYVTDHNHGIYQGNQQSNIDIAPESRKLTENGIVIIEDNVWLGDNVVVLPNVTIGYGSIIGANSVVSKDIPAYSIAVGSPAKVIKKYNPDCHKWIKEGT